MAQQTALEWLSDNLIGNPYTEEDFIHNVSVFKQAKQMEKQQLANTWDAACDRYILLEGNLVKVWKDFDKYYNETYNK